MTTLLIFALLASSAITHRASIADVPVGIGLGVFVTIGASGSLGGSGYRSLTTKHGSQSALNVYLSGNRLQVMRVYAAPNAAEMIKIEPVWNLLNMQFIGNAMGGFHAAISASDVDAGVASVVNAPCPNPATGFGDHFNKTHKAFFQGLYPWSSRHADSLTDGLVSYMGAKYQYAI